MPTLLPRLATSELVALAWIRDIVTAYDVAAGTTLQGPDPETQVLSWGDTGFVTALTVGGDVHPTSPLQQPVLSIEAVATNVGKSRPPWGRAAVIAQLIVNASQWINWGDTARPVTLPTGFPTCRVLDGTALGVPKRIPSDEANYARYQWEMSISWVSL